MFERYINILIVNEDETESKSICSMLEHQAHNIHSAHSGYQALNLLKEKEFGIIILSLDMKRMDGLDFLKAIKSNSKTSNRFTIVTCQSTNSEDQMVASLAMGAVDFIQKPFNENIVRSKINVFKKLYFNQQRVLQLLRNVLPDTILEEFNKYGKSSPKRYENGIIMFTDFVNFSAKSISIQPIELIKKLDTYFKKFDQIIEKYNLEKIKTIGDAYMVVAGLNNNVNDRDYVAMTLASMEMKNFVLNEERTSKAFGEDPWQMRMGIHTGPIVGGVIGSKKFSFDVWGDSVNIAARTEEMCKPGELYATAQFIDRINQYFETEAKGSLEIRKRGGHYNMFSIKGLKKEFALFNNSNIPGVELRKLLQLPSVDFEHTRTAIVNKLKSGLDEKLVYHSLEHTINVEKSAIRLAKLESISSSDLILLRTAVLFHDSGFLVQYGKNEHIGVLIMQSMLPPFGYSEKQIEIIEKIILSTNNSIEPITILEKIMCDADHDYLGKPNYHSTAKKLRIELESRETIMTEFEWINFQINYLEKEHQYHTVSAKSMRGKGKLLRIAELKVRLGLLETVV